MFLCFMYYQEIVHQTYIQPSKQSNDVRSKIRRSSFHESMNYSNKVKIIIRFAKIFFMYKTKGLYKLVVFENLALSQQHMHEHC